MLYVYQRIVVLAALAVLEVLAVLAVLTVLTVGSICPKICAFTKLLIKYNLLLSNNVKVRDPVGFTHMSETKISKLWKTLMRCLSWHWPGVGPGSGSWQGVAGVRAEEGAGQVSLPEQEQRLVPWIVAFYVRAWNVGTQSFHIHCEVPTSALTFKTQEHGKLTLNLDAIGKIITKWTSILTKLPVTYDPCWQAYQFHIYLLCFGARLA